MALSERVAAQLRKPSGLVGRLVISRLLNMANGAMNQMTLGLLELAPDDRVIEVGFGGGDLIRRMLPLVRQGRIVGVDFSQEMVDLCMRRFAAPIQSGLAEFACAEAENLPYGSERFTKACTVNTIYFWPDPLGPLRELNRVLGGGGRLVVSFSPRATMEKIPYAKHGFVYFELRQVLRLMEDAGFVGVRMVLGSGPFGEYACAVGAKPDRAVA